MPIRAILDDREVYSFDFTDTEWFNLSKRIKKKESNVILPCCNQSGFTRISSQGLKHFVHFKSNNSCDWKPESQEHIKSKIEIIKGCRLAGWNAIPEVSGTNWRADVLANKENKKIAFEVQWSYQTLDMTLLRQRKYESSGVRCCWLFKKPPKDMCDYNGDIESNKYIPAFKLIQHEDLSLRVVFDGRNIPLNLFISDLLKGRYKYCAHFRSNDKQRLNVSLFASICYNCLRTLFSYHILNSASYFSSTCGKKFNASAFSINIHDKIEDRINTLRKVTKNLYKPLIGCFDNGKFACPYCSASGPYFNRTINWESKWVIDIKIDVDSITSEEVKHWCYSETNNFCE